MGKYGDLRQRSAPGLQMTHLQKEIITVPARVHLNKLVEEGDKDKLLLVQITLKSVHSYFYILSEPSEDLSY